MGWEEGAERSLEPRSDVVKQMQNSSYKYIQWNDWTSGVTNNLPSSTTWFLCQWLAVWLCFVSTFHSMLLPCYCSLILSIVSTSGQHREHVLRWEEQFPSAFVLCLLPQVLKGLGVAAANKGCFRVLCLPKGKCVPSLYGRFIWQIRSVIIKLLHSRTNHNFKYISNLSTCKIHSDAVQIKPLTVATWASQMNMEYKNQGTS